MKKRTKWVIGVAVLTLAIGGYAMSELVFGFGDEAVKRPLSKREKQIAYLKEHEQEIVDFIKLQNEKIESVQIDWNDVRGGKVSNPFSSEEYVSLYGTFNEIEESGWSVVIPTVDGKLDVNEMYQGGYLTIGGDVFE